MASARLSRPFEFDPHPSTLGRRALPQDLQTVEACLKAKIATAEVVHINASLIRANVDWDSLVERHVDEVLEKKMLPGQKTELRRPVARAEDTKKICVTDPDATMATSARNRRLEPAYNDTPQSMTKSASFSMSW